MSGSHSYSVVQSLLLADNAWRVCVRDQGAEGSLWKTPEAKQGQLRNWRHSVKAGVPNSSPLAGPLPSPSLRHRVWTTVTVPVGPPSPVSGPVPSPCGLHWPTPSVLLGKFFPVLSTTLALHCLPDLSPATEPIAPAPAFVPSANTTGPLSCARLCSRPQGDSTEQARQGHCPRGACVLVRGPAGDPHGSSHTTRQETCHGAERSAEDLSAERARHHLRVS